MDEKLHIVHHLYGEDTDPAELRRLLEDEALREEYEALSEVKFHLDHRKRARPDAQVIDRIVAAAAVPQSGATARKRPDRAARPGWATRRFRAIGAVSAVLAVVLTVGIGLSQFQEFIPSASDAAMEAGPAEVEAFSNSRDAPATAGTRQPEALRLDERRAGPPAAPAPAEFEGGLLDADVAGEAKEEEAVPSWDEADELLRVHRGIEMIRARSLDLTWDESAVMSLDSLPTEPDAAFGLEAASTRRRARRDNQ